MFRVFQRFPSAVLPAVAALAAIPCLAAPHARHAAGSTHPAMRARAVVSTRGSSRRPVRGRYAAHTEYVERIAPVHHEPVPSMETTRATEIQTALIRAGYLSGEPSGVWDAGSIAAMQKLQDDNGWQTKYTPDSRALVKLGLGGAPVQPAQPVQATDATPATPTGQQ